MDINALPGLHQTTPSRKPVSSPRTPPAQSGLFARILSNATKPTEQRSGPPAQATLGRLPLQRSTVFMQNMSLEQRRSAVEEKGFLARPAMLERVSILVADQAGRSQGTESNRCRPPKPARSWSEHNPYAPGHEFESNGAAQKHRVKEASSNPDELRAIIKDFMHNTMNLELLDLSDYPLIRYYATGEPVTRESTAYFSDMLHSVRAQRKQLYETEMSKGISDYDMLKKLIAFNDNLPDRFKKMTNW